MHLVTFDLLPLESDRENYLQLVHALGHWCHIGFACKQKETKFIHKIIQNNPLDLYVKVNKECFCVPFIIL